MAGYTRQDTLNNIADGNIINASDFDNEYDAIEAAFSAVSGHTHDGTAAEGAAITKVGPAQDVVVSASAVLPKTDNTLDLGSSSFEFKDLYIDGTANIDSLVADTADINAGTIDGVVIGGASAGAGTFTSLNASGNISFDGGSFVFNESGADKDARFEGDGDPNLLFLDASTDRVGVGTNVPTKKLTIFESTLPGAFGQFSNVTGSPATIDDQEFSAWYANAAVSGLTFSPSDARLLTFTVTQDDEIAVRAPALALWAESYNVFYTDGLERARFDVSGNFGIGTDTPLRILDVVGAGVTDGQLLSSVRIQSNASYNTFPKSGIQFSSLYTSGNATAGMAGIAGGKENTIDGDEAGFLALYSRPSGGNITEQARITSGGDVGIGTSSPATKLTVFGGASGTDTRTTIGNAASALQVGVDSSNNAVVATNTANSLGLYTNNNLRLKIEANGDLIYQVNGTAPTLSTNSTMSFELTSNTSLKVVVRGTDGVTRSVSLTLS